MMDVDSEGTQSKDAEPFGEIALSFSGGGVRAVGFHLGSLSYLDHVGLREDVRILSTVSGGTFVGLSYATSLKLHGEDFDFVSYYRSLVRWDDKPKDRGYLYLSTLDKVLRRIG